MTHRPASTPSRAAFGCALLLLGVALGCAPAGPGGSTSAAPTSPANATPSTGAAGFATSPSPVATDPPSVPPRPSGTLEWPTTFDVELEQGTYFSSPPFEIPFAITLDESGWFSGHLHEEFFDLLRFDGVPHTGLPTRMLAFGVPRHFRGATGDVPVAGLTAETAADTVEGASYLTVSNRMDVELLGLEGVRIDIHSTLQNTPVFGGAAGTFGLSPEHDARMAILERGDGFLLVLVLAPPDELDAAWTEAQPILDSVAFAG